jgi:hypothetical protein
MLNILLDGKYEISPNIILKDYIYNILPKHVIGDRQMLH